LRKLQLWNLTSILEEYRRFLGDRSQPLSEQFIEFFDTDLVGIPDSAPAWLPLSSDLGS
jgi:tyrosine-protein phosphatase OCA1